MPYKRIAAAAALLLVATYLKLCIPAFAELAIPAMQAVMDTEQISLPLPISWADKLVWD